MKPVRCSFFPLFMLLCSLAFAGCGTVTTVRLTGPAETQVSGRYRADHVSSDFFGTANWKMEMGRQTLQEFEFRKATVASAVNLEIRQGRRPVVRATAEPGVAGLRVRKESGWKVETLK